MIPIDERTVTAPASRAAYQAGQQRECSHAWPVGSMPWGKQRVVRMIATTATPFGTVVDRTEG
jgi:hypothetical protein